MKTKMLSEIILAGLITAFSITAAVAAPPGPPKSKGCGSPPPAVPGITSGFQLEFGGEIRSYNVHLPPGYDERTPASLVLSFHGYGGTAEGQELNTTNMSVHADENDYIVVYPQSTRFPGGIFGDVESWNDLSCSGSPGPEGPICAFNAFSYPVHPVCANDEARDDCNWCACGVDDVGFVDTLLDELEDNFCIDLKSVYAAGFSNGGMFVHRLGCNLAHRFAAIAPVSGTLSKGFNCSPPQGARLSVMHIFGTKDNTVPADGTTSTDGFFYIPVADVIEEWAGQTSQDCGAEEVPFATSEDGVRKLQCTERPNCSTGAQVVSCSWNGNHTWPTAKNGMPFGNNVIWEFFMNNRED